MAKLNSIKVSNGYIFNENSNNVFNDSKIMKFDTNGIYKYIRDDTIENLTYPIYKHQNFDCWIKILKKKNNYCWLLFIPSDLDDTLNREIPLYMSSVIANIDNIKDGPDNQSTWIPVWNLKTDQLIEKAIINRIIDYTYKPLTKDHTHLIVNLCHNLYSDSDVIYEYEPISGIYEKIDTYIYVNTKNQNFIIIKNLKEKEWQLVNIDKEIDIKSVLFHIPFDHHYSNEKNDIIEYYWPLKNIYSDSIYSDQYNNIFRRYIHLNNLQVVNVKLLNYEDSLAGPESSC